MPSTTPPDQINLSDAERRLLDRSSHTDREYRLHELLKTLEESREIGSHPDVALSRARIQLEVAGLQLDIDERDQAWSNARQSIDVFIAQQHFEDAAVACQYIYLSAKDDAISAIGQAAWLAVTYPVSPQLTINVLDHIIDETPDNSDGAAVAAAAAHYVADLRCTDKELEEVKIFTGAMLARVAKRHSNIENQQQFDQWVKTLELDDPDKFLIRLRNVIDVMVQDDWWFDRQALSNEIPDGEDEI